MPQNEIDVVFPTVRISGSDVTDMRVLRITKRIGITPSTCELQYNAGQDVTGPVTLTNAGTYKHKQRVIVYRPAFSQIWFQGWLTQRQDQHAASTSIWSASDDTLLLRHAWLRGCILQDKNNDASLSLKYSATLGAVFNPNGAWNCTGREINGVVYPVFTPVAMHCKAYETPDTNYAGDPPTDGSFTPWTPRRILKYLQLVMHSTEIYGGMIPGDSDYVYGSIKSDYLYLDPTHIDNLDGIDPAIEDSDPLDRLASELSLQGDSLAGAFEKVLKMCGTHSMATLYDTTGLTPSGLSGVGKTLLRFKPVGYVSQEDWNNLSVQFNGTANVAQGNIFDFSLLEDSQDTTRAVYCEGQPQYLETELKYEGEDKNETTNTLVPAWTDLQEYSFQSVVFGDVLRSTSRTTTTLRFAIMPKVAGVASKNASDFEVCDGEGGRPLVRADSPEAIALAMQCYPTVFRAFQIKIQGDLKNAIINSETGDSVVEWSRPILPTQLQYLTYESDKLGDTQLRFNLPIRVQIQPSEFDQYYDVPRDVAIRVTTDDQGVNLLWLDGCGPSVDGSIECVYGPNLMFSTIQNEEISLRNIKINCAFPLDWRVNGFKRADSLPNISSEYDNAFDGEYPFSYLDYPKSFRGYRQWKSSPAKNLKYYGGENGLELIEAPLDRFLPPGDESIHALYAARRELSRIRRPIRNSSWMLAGIDRSVDSGDWIGWVYVYKNGTPTEYLVDAHVSTVVFDFLKQTTTVGDVFGSSTYGQI